jgi:hypothetical protein
VNDPRPSLRDSGQDPADPVAAYLVEVRERSDRPLGPIVPISNDAVRYLMESAADVPRLAAAVEAALDLADGWDNLSSPPSAVPALHATLLRTRAFELREAISRALLGEGETRA